MSHTTSQTTPTFTGFAGTYGQNYIDTFSLALNANVPLFKQQVYPELVQLHGGWKMFDLLRILGKEIFIKGDRFTVFEQPASKTLVTISAVSPAGTTWNGTDPIYFKISAADYSSGASRLRLNDVVYFPGARFNRQYPVAAVITAISTSGNIGGLTAGPGADTVYTSRILESGLSIVTAIGTANLLIGQNIGGRGTGQPASTVETYLQRNFLSGIAKETFTIDGGVNAFERQIAVGENTIWDAAIAAEEIELDRGIEFALWSGVTNTNNVTLNNTEDGSAVAARSTMGLLPLAETFGQKLIINTAFNNITDFNFIRDLHLAQGCAANTFLILAGPTLYSQIENTLLAHSDNGAATLYDNMLQQFGVVYKRVFKNNRLYYIVEIPSLANPYHLNATGFGYSNNGFVIPLQDVATNIVGQMKYGGDTYTEMSGKVIVPNLAIGYLNNNGEDRRRIIAPVYGVNGMGKPASHQFDKSSVYMMSEFMLIALRMNEIVRIR